jgi:phospholipid/cholesterol/gamma-HCH transport system ATP-binding protein
MDLIEISKFNKSFGAKVVHKNISFTVKKGECLGLIGGSGTGKSVLLRSLIGLERPDSGHVIFKYQNITSLKERALIEIRKQIAYVFQGGALFDSMTVFDNLAYPLRAHTKLGPNEMSHKIKDLLSDFGLSGSEKLFPSSLSGGMQKRVGLARSIILGPEVILYDEPTAGLDPYNTKGIQELILRLKARGTTAILVTHDMPVAFAVCDRIAILLDGEIKAIDETDHVKKNPDHLIYKFSRGEF